MRGMVRAGEADHLIAERVWAELQKALTEARPAAFFQVLRECGALQVVFPEINALFGVPQPEKHHPEIDTGVHALMALEQASSLTGNPEVRLAAVLHDLGKALTPRQFWPRHHGHEKIGLTALDKFCERLRVPKTFKTLSAHVMEYHIHCHNVLDLRADTLTDMLYALGAFKPDSRVEEFILACEADARGRTGFENRSYPQADFIRLLLKHIETIDTVSIVHSNLQGAEIGAAIRQLRISAVKNFKLGWEQAC